MDAGEAPHGTRRPAGWQLRAQGYSAGTSAVHDEYTPFWARGTCSWP